MDALFRRPMRSWPTLRATMDHRLYVQQHTVFPLRCAYSTRHIGDGIHSSQLLIKHSHKIAVSRNGQGTQPEMYLSNDVNWSGLCCYSHA